MRIVYMGTPQFAVRPLLALSAAGHEISGVVTRVDKPAGRGRALAAPPVKTAALKKGFFVHQPRRVRDPEFIETLRRTAPDVIVVAAYGQILPKDILTIPRHGCVNIHASLLPRYRGAAPINWAIVRGEAETGITIMQMDEGMDTGGILTQERVPIEAADTAGSLTDKLSDLGARMIVEALKRIDEAALPVIAQDSSAATMAPILKKQDGLIDWSLPAREIRNRVRGLNPWPGAYTFLDGKLIKILESDMVPGEGRPGELRTAGAGALHVGTGEGLLSILQIQPEGKRPMSVAEFLRGHRDAAGKKFDRKTGPREG